MMPAPGPSFPTIRPRRLRQSAALRQLVQETHLRPDQLVLPLFVTEGTQVKHPIASMPGVYQRSIDGIVQQAKRAQDLGLLALNLFGVPNASQKDEDAELACQPDGLIPRTIQALKQALPNMLVITDICLCEWLSHGHCGLVHQQQILNDQTLPLLTRMAQVHAQAGADVVAPSDMMDGRVGAIRAGLDAVGCENTSILAYSAKYASCLYAPFREAANGAPRFGDRASYQMDCANAREAEREILLDLAEGADMVMVKPALTSLDIIARAKALSPVPVVAYQVSGEYSMLHAAAQQGWLELERTMMETLLSIKRAGADLIFTYFALDAARHLQTKG